MLYRSNILALVGGGKTPKYYLSKVMLWDDHQVKNIGEMSFRSEVKAVKLRSNKCFKTLNLLNYIEIMLKFMFLNI